uniref:Uncharacterized protein n=1 Tax=Arundo donax TaxID=35708 RepID=A0A0A9BDW5_ARUDO
MLAQVHVRDSQVNYWTLHVITNHNVYSTNKSNIPRL